MSLFAVLWLVFVGIGKRGMAWLHRHYGALSRVYIGWKSFGSVYIGWMEKICMYGRVVACIHSPSG